MNSKTNLALRGFLLLGEKYGITSNSAIRTNGIAVVTGVNLIQQYQHAIKGELYES